MLSVIRTAPTGMRRASLAPSSRAIAPRPVTVRFQDERSENKTSTSQGIKSIDQQIIDDHNKVRFLWKEYQKASDSEEKQNIAFQMIRELSMHGGKEEEVVYPVINKVFGKEEGQHLLDEHMGLKQRMDALQKMDPEKDMNAFDNTVKSLIELTEHHAKDEEEHDIPRLLKEPGIDAEKLARDFADAATHAITRPHPWAPDKAPVNWFTNRMTAPLDAALDAVRFKGKPPSVNPPQ